MKRVMQLYMCNVKHLGGRLQVLPMPVVGLQYQWSVLNNADVGARSTVVSWLIEDVVSVTSDPFATEHGRKS